MPLRLLGRAPEGPARQETIYNNADNIYKNAVASLYNYVGSNQESEGLQGTCRGIYDYNTLTTDEAMIPIRGGDWYDGGLWENMYQHKWSANDIYLYDVWKYLFKVIVLSNQSLSIIDSHRQLLSAEQEHDYTAEVRAVRALFYYYAMDMFGRIPIVTSYDVTLDQVVQSERSEGYELESNYASNFAVHNETSKENIFTIPLDKNLYQNEYHYLFRSHHYNHGGAYGRSSENGTYAMVSTVKSFGYGTDHEDTRFRTNFYTNTVFVDGKKIYLDNGDPLVYRPLELKLNLTGSPYKQTAGACIGKYKVDCTAYSDGRQVDNDIILFRYGDVLLMEAEAKVRNGEDGSTELNAIREIVGMPVGRSQFGQHPKGTTHGTRVGRLETAGPHPLREITKAYDQRTPVDGEETGFTTVFPIPQKCLDLNKKYRQNKGYEQRCHKH